MTLSTDMRVASRTLAAPLMTLETVPTPKPEAAATSAIVARRADDIVTLLNGTGRGGGTGSITELDRRSAPPRRQEQISRESAWERCANGAIDARLRPQVISTPV